MMSSVAYYVRLQVAVGRVGGGYVQAVIPGRPHITHLDLDNGREEGQSAVRGPEIVSLPPNGKLEKTTPTTATPL